MTISTFWQQLCVRHYTTLFCGVYSFSQEYRICTRLNWNWCIRDKCKLCLMDYIIDNSYVIRKVVFFFQFIICSIYVFDTKTLRLLSTVTRLILCHLYHLNVTSTLPKLTDKPTHLWWCVSFCVTYTQIYPTNTHSHKKTQMGPLSCPFPRRQTEEDQTDAPPSRWCHRCHMNFLVI